MIMKLDRNHDLKTMASTPPFRKKTKTTTHTQILFNYSSFHQYAKTNNFSFEPQPGDHPDIFFGPVALLQGGYGAYADKRIEPDTRLGVYHGVKQQFEMASLTETKDQREYFFQTDADDDYLYGINGKDKRNFAAMVNGTSEHNANVEARQEGSSIVFYATEEIHPGEQLLICYGDEYTMSREEAIMLNPKDNWRTSTDLLLEFNKFYEYSGEFSPILATFLNLPPAQYQLIRPNPFRTNDRVSVDLPLLRSQVGERRLLPTTASENLSQLMYYCWLGDVALVKHCLKRGANPNRQSAKLGLTSLHMVLSAPGLEVESRIEIILNLLAYGAHFKVTSASGYCPLDFLVNNSNLYLPFDKKIEIVEALIKADIVSDTNRAELNKLYGSILHSFVLSIDEKHSLITILQASNTPDFVNEHDESLFIKIIEYGNFQKLVAIEPFVGQTEICDIEEGGLNEGPYQGAIEALIASEEIEKEDKKNIITWLFVFFIIHDGSESLTDDLIDKWEDHFESDSPLQECLIPFCRKHFDGKPELIARLESYFETDDEESELDDLVELSSDCESEEDDITASARALLAIRQREERQQEDDHTLHQVQNFRV
jgi:hypothetical protein